MRRLKKPRWAISENQVTDERLFRNRRGLLMAGAGLAAAGTGLALLSGGSPMPGTVAQAAVPPAGGPETAWTPKPPRAPAFASAGRDITAEHVNATYNNFYEFGSHKQIRDAAQALETEGWTVKIDGMVAKELKLDMDQLLRAMPVEERVYRHRCVEAWSMVVPWIGFPLAELVKLAEPTSGAKYLRFETFQDPDTARGQRAFWYPWPYVEGVTMAEATNDLAFMVTGAYGKVLHKQFGAPVRLHLPWKYGFKSIKSIVRITFTDQRPVSFWEQLQDKEYGFWANVNPEVPHPRWSQATERVLGSLNERIPTQMWNGYGEEVAHLYAGMESELGDRLYR